MTALAGLKTRVVLAGGVLVAALALLHGCNNPVCACLPPPSLGGRWVGRADSGDSLDLRFEHEPPATDFTGTGRVGIAPRYHTVSLVGRVDLAQYVIERFTLYGWQDAPVEYVADGTTPTYGQTQGRLRFANGESTRVALRRLGP